MTSALVAGPQAAAALEESCASELRLGWEVEFYVGGRDFRYSEVFDLARAELATFSDNVALSVEHVASQQQEGRQQWEVSVGPVRSVQRLVETAAEVMSRLDRLVHDHGGGLDFSQPASPAEAYSGMHLSVSLWQAERNTFAAPSSSAGGRQRRMIAGQLLSFRALFDVFCPAPGCAARYRPRSRSDELFSPTTLSWGVNTRAVAVRAVFDSSEPDATRIENRLACSCATVADLCSAVLLGSLLGMHFADEEGIPQARGLPRDHQVSRIDSPDHSGDWTRSDLHDMMTALGLT